MRLLRIIIIFCFFMAITALTFAQSNGYLFPIPSDNTWGYIDQNGSLIIEPRFLEADDFHEGLARVKTQEGYGFINNNGDFVIPPKFAYANDFSEGVARVRDAEITEYIDTNGRVLFQLQGGVSGEDCKEGLIAFSDHSHTGYLNLQGQVVISPLFIAVEQSFGRSFSEGTAVVSYSEKIQITDRSYSMKQHFGYIGRAGNIVIPPIFSWAGPFSEGRAYVEIDDAGMTKYGYIDLSGRFIFGPNPDKRRSLPPVFSEGRGVISINGKYGAVDRNGVIMIQPQFDFMGNFSDGLAPIRMENSEGKRLYGFVDKNGSVVIQPRFTYAGQFNHGLAKVYDAPNIFIGYINKEGNFVWKVDN